ncbi:Cytochrome c oxidase assembly protein cox15, partial [Kickxella alabastrina]
MAVSMAASTLLQRSLSRTLFGNAGSKLTTPFLLSHLSSINTRQLSTTTISISRLPAQIGRANFLRASAGVPMRNRGSSIIANHIPTGAFRRSMSLSASVEGASSGPPRRTVDAPIVGYWTLFCASMVFGIIVWGGLTRLTESGLSIVEWALISGAKLPTSDEQWESEFEKYKQFPEYHKVHIGITLDDFKKIYFMEWFHRNIGRLFGVVYLLPAAYFVSKGMVTRAGVAKIGGLGLLLLGQGVMGWYMV